MERIIIALKIARLVCKKRLFGLSPAEEEELASACRQGMEGVDIPALADTLSPSSLEERYSAVDPAAEWSLFRKRVGKRHRLRWWAAAAAVCLLLAGGGAAWWLRSEEPVTVLARKDVRDGISLILANGEKVNLSDSSSCVALDPGTTLHARHLSYAQDSAAEEPVYNTLVIPKGTQYRLVLADGTRVWLNADSKLHYPVRFGTGEREVCLKGEAYFEVSRDTARPFVVRTEGMNVRVLGTRFNVNSYRDDGRTYAVLAEGSVEVYNGRGSRLLRPGQMASTDGEGEEAAIRVDNCDAALHTAWREGQFRFRNTSLTQILKQISRCYDVTIVLERDYQEEYYSGDISYLITLPTLLKAIEASTSVRFDIEGDTVFMRKK